MSTEILTKEDLAPLLAEFKRQDRKMELLAVMLESFGARSHFGVADIARMMGCAVNTVKNKPFLLPNFGLSDFPSGRRKWRLETVMKWLEKSPEDHERTWYGISTAERRRMMSARKMGPKPDRSRVHKETA